MERIFADSVHAEIDSYGFDSDCLLFPIRHHSPVCSYQLINTIKQYNPDIILVEGPENACELIPVLTDEGTMLPVAFYYYYKDTRKLISEEGEDYKCYYPFLNSSPEYNALIEAKKLEIPARFIDLPYGEILIGTRKGEGFTKDTDRHNYADDSGLLRNRFYEKICEKTGLRSFEEFWEKYFEIEGIRKTPQEFLRQMHTYCALIRDDVSLEELQADGTSIREQYMAYCIRKASKEYKKVLVVTGGFHSLGIARLLNSDEITSPALHKISSKDSGCYPMAYSYEAADALHGYASGMATPFFYDSIMKRLKEEDCVEDIYNQVTLDFLVRTAKECAKKDICVTMSDTTSALAMMQGLAALRNCPESGMFELMDAITATFIKGEKTISSAYPLEIVRKLATGREIGKIGDKSHIPPLLKDFEIQCEKLGLNCASVVPKQLEISLFTSHKGMEQSRFLHRMTYLETGFAKRKKGPDLHNHIDCSRVREQWSYRRTPGVDSVLIDHMTDGFTVLEACTTDAMKKMRKAHLSETVATVSVDCFLMGIDLQANDHQRIDDIITNDGDFFSVGEALYHFDTLCNLQKLYGFEDSHYMIYRDKCFDKLITAIPYMVNVADEHVKQCISILRHMYHISQKMDIDKQNIFYEALITMTEIIDKEATIYGAVMGILYVHDSQQIIAAKEALKGYLSGTSEIQKQGSNYLKGLFETARDVMMADDTFLQLVDELLISLDTEDFMEILPNLRLAFSYFTPVEIQSIAIKVADIYKTDSKDITNKTGINEGLIYFGEKLDREVCQELERMDIHEQ